MKIGYADDVQTRLKQLNNSECIPFAFRVYATYEVGSRLTDLKVHSMIDKINPDLRSVETINGKTRKREFYAMAPEDAYSIFEALAEINGCPEKLKLWKLTSQEQKAEKEAKEIEAESRTKADKFKFSMCNIKPGEYVEYANDVQPDVHVKCKVHDDKHVEYNGEIMSLTSLARILNGKSYHVAGPQFFKYNGEWLNDLRHQNGF